MRVIPVLISIAVVVGHRGIVPTIKSRGATRGCPGSRGSRGGGPPLETCRVGVGRPPRHTNSKGTAVKESSQIQPVGATALPERVSVAMAEIAENMQEG